MMRRYSLLSLVLVLTVVAFASAFLLQRKNVARLTNENRSLEAKLDATRERTSIELANFWGANGDPLMLVWQRDERPELFQIKNSKFMPVSRGFLNINGASGTPRLGWEIRLLRTIDNIDYYRLKYKQIDGSPPKELLFSYDGGAKILIASNDELIGIGPQEPTVLKLLSEHFSAEQIAGFQTGQTKIRIQTPFYPSQGRPNEG